MLRRLHSLPGLLLAIMLVMTAGSGAILALDPPMDRVSNPLASGASVASLAEAVASRRASVDRIVVRPSGAVTASYADGEEPAIERVDPVTGAPLGPYQVSGWTRFMTNLHRSFLLGDAGRAGSGVSALAILALSVSGAWLLARRAGGWRAILRRQQGRGAQRWHAELSRFALLGMLLTSLTGLFMSAETFGLVPEPRSAQLSHVASGEAPARIGSLSALRNVDISGLRELSFPAQGNVTDVFTLRTGDGEAAIDQGTGAILAFAPAALLDRIREIVRLLHTGRGAWLLALLLGASSACVPALGVTGALIWWRRRANAPRVSRNATAACADTVILVGSEGHATWGFAATLHEALTKCGHMVHTTAMNDLLPVHAKAARLIVMTSTYGNGSAPSSAKNFIARLAVVPAAAPVAVLGFGDRNFPQFCSFAQEVSNALDENGWLRLMPLKRVDRQSAQEFAQWGHDLGTALGHDLALEHVVAPPKTSTLELMEREDYGAAVGAPVAILRFRAPNGRLPTFEAGDLVGIVPPGSTMARFYSLASSSGDGVVEICVRAREGGLCSTFLHALSPGETIKAFIRENPGFRPSRGRSALILIGAGAGVGPLAGFVRANENRRPMHLYWGGRNPSSDFLYEHEWAQHLAEKRLTSLNTAFSRTGEGAYVQDRIAADAPRLRELIRHGAQVLVCGGRDMARDVTQTLDGIVRPLGLDLATLRSSGRYVEDVY